MKLGIKPQTQLISIFKKAYNEVVADMKVVHFESRDNVYFSRFEKRHNYIIETLENFLFKEKIIATSIDKKEVVSMYEYLFNHHIIDEKIEWTVNMYIDFIESRMYFVCQDGGGEHFGHIKFNHTYCK